MGSRASFDHIQPDSIARFGRSGSSTNPRTLPGSRSTRRSSVRTGFGRGTSVFGAGRQSQRVAVKVHLVRHYTPQKGRESIARHSRYIGREGVSQDAQRGVFYGPKLDGMEAQDLAAKWAEDRHHFRVIVSPERGRELPDLTDYTRDVMRRVEADLGTRLEWVAVNHFNTDNPHIHVLLRGRDERHRDLVIQRDYIGHGMRERAQQVATERIGERTVDHARESLRKQVYAERWTELDRVLERLAKRTESSLHLDLSKTVFRPGAVVDADMIGQRLRVLEGLQLASASRSKLGFARNRPAEIPRRWSVVPDFSTALNDLGERNDAIKQIHAAMGQKAQNLVPRIERFRNLSTSSRRAIDDPQTTQRAERVTGTLLAKGTVDELTDRRFVLVQDVYSAESRPLHAYVRASEEYDAATPGSVVQLGPTRYRESYLSIIAGPSLQNQVKAKAWTWLDRQLYRSRSSNAGEAVAHSQDVQTALDARAEWLIAQGYAIPSAFNSSSRSIRFRSGARDELLIQELRGLIAGKPAAPSLLQPGQTATGRYAGTAYLHQGTVVTLERNTALIVVPVRRYPHALETGATVHATMRSDRRVSFEVVSPPREPDVRSRQPEEVELEGGR